MKENTPTALVTGAASGMGNHIAKVLHRAGYRVMAADINDTALKNEFPQTEKLLTQKLDISHAGSWREALSRLLDHWQKIDYCLNIAGVGKPQFFEEIGIEELDFQLNVNTKGTYYGTVICGQQMINQGFGHIINIASLAGVAPIKGVSVYSGSKFAVRGFSLAVAYELKEKGVDLTVLCPDLVNTPMMDMLIDHPEESAMTFSGTKRPLQVEDVEKAVWKAIRKKPFEICIPNRRGFMAKLGSMFPQLAYQLGKTMEKKGSMQLAQIKKQQ